MPLPLTVSCFSKIQIGFTFLVPARLGSPEKGPLNGCVCVLLTYLLSYPWLFHLTVFLLIFDVNYPYVGGTFENVCLKMVHKCTF